MELLQEGYMEELHASHGVMTLRTFGELLKHLRRQAHMTQRDLALATGYSVGQICRFEQNQHVPDLPTLTARFLPALLSPNDTAMMERLLALADTARVAQRQGQRRPPPVLLAPEEPGIDHAFVRTLPPLPIPATPLLGRARDVAQICALLQQATVRLVTLTGAPGIGKTRLGLQVANDLHATFADGVVFVPLAPISDPTLVISAIAQTLGIIEIGGQPLVNQLKQFLGDKHLLLLLDNFEHVLDAAPLIAEVLASAGALKLLVTSRERLHIRGEKEVAVPPLALPDRTNLPPVDQLAQYAAIALFIQRAVDARSDFQITSTNAAAVAEICVCLEGLPLAIELAAARSKLFAPAAMVARLSSRLALLTGGVRDLPLRQQTMRATIAWSYDLLTEAEQMLLRRLGVFVGGCTLEAAAAVCNADGALAIDVMDGLAWIVDKSLLHLQGGVDGEPRVMMLEMIREYALEQIAARGEVELLRAQHFAYYLALAEAAEPYLRGAAQIVWAERLEVEHDNFRAALTWAHNHEAVDGFTTGGVEAELRLAGALFWFWDMRDYQIEGQRWLEGALARTNAPTHTAARARALFVAGHFAVSQGNYVAGRARLEESVALWRALGDTRGLALALTDGRGLGWVALMERRVAEARTMFTEGVALWREIGDTWGLAKGLWSLGAAVRREDPAAARPIVEAGVALYREAGDLNGLAEALPQLGVLARLEGDHTRATALLEESLALSRNVGDKSNISGALQCLGDVVQDQGDYAHALALYQESLALARLVEAKEGIARCLVGIAGVAGALRQGKRAARLLSAAETLLDTIGLSLAVWPETRADYDRYLAAARTQVDAAIFTTAWAQGRTILLDEVVADALRYTG